MNFNDAEKEIRDFFNTAWATLTPIAWPDVDFTPPSNTAWVRFNCQENDGEQVSMGDPNNNRFRHYGIVTIQIFQAQGNAGIIARAKAAAAVAVFMGAQTTNGITFRKVYPKQIGNDGNGFYQINVLASFYYDEIT